MASLVLAAPAVEDVKQNKESDPLKAFSSIPVPIVEVTRLGDFPVDGGGYADVWRGKRVPDGLEVALKGIRVNHEDEVLVKLLLREISIWSTLEHCNVLPFLGLSVQPGFRIPYLVSPWLPYGNVMKYLEARESANRKELIQGVADGLIYLHQKGIVHGDVKGANILVTSDGCPVLADFGLSVIDAQNSQSQTTTQTFAGSARWMAPERLVPEQYGLTGRTSRTSASDVFSFGMTVYQIFTGQFPYAELGNMEASMALVSGKRPMQPGDAAKRRGMTPSLWTFVVRCWDAQPSARPDLHELHKYLDTAGEETGLEHHMADTHITETPPPAYAALPSTQALPSTEPIDVYLPCPFCAKDNAYGYVCLHPIPELKKAKPAKRAEYAQGHIPAGHSECVNCSRLVPKRTAFKSDRCAVCTAVFCENVYGSCPGPFTFGKLRPLSGWFSDEPAAEMVEMLSPYLFFGNRYEQQKFRNYLFEKGFTFLELLQSVAATHTDQQLPRAKWHGPALGTEQKSFGLTDLTCNHCAMDLMEGNLFDWYLEQRSTDEVLRLQSPTIRADCPRGASCQDAITDYHHATRFNHICLSTVSQPLQAPSLSQVEGNRTVISTSDPVATFRGLFLPDQVGFRDRDGQASFMATCYDGQTSFPAKATLWDWEWTNNVRNRIKPHFQVYHVKNGSEYAWRANFSILNETQDMEWVRCEHGRVPQDRRPVVGGRGQNGSILHHAAVWWKTRRRPGKVSLELGRAVIGYNGREISVVEDYDVLCWK